MKFPSIRDFEKVESMKIKSVTRLYIHGYRVMGSEWEGTEESVFGLVG